MNTPNPLVPQGSLQQQATKKVSVPVAVFSILAAHVVVLGLLLAQGCNPKKSGNLTDTSASNNVPSITASTDVISNPASAFPPLGSTGSASPYFTAATTSSPAPNNLTSSAVAPPYSGTLGNTATGATGLGSDPRGGTAVMEKPNPVDTGTSEGHDYTVAKGDTLGKIAKKNGVKLSALKKANPNVVPEKLKVGQKLTIPGSGKAMAETSGTAVASTSVADSGEGTSYKVKTGDTLTKIAKAHGTTAKKLRAFNSLTTDRIKVGQSLKIPAGGGDAVKVVSRTGSNDTTASPINPTSDVLPSSTLTPVSAPAGSNGLAH